MKHHITNINIKNFKCFKDFEVKDLARVNLITGKNNVGKTAFLEACYIAIQKHKNAILQLFIIRNKRNYIYYDRHIELNGTVNPLKFLLKTNIMITINKKPKFTIDAKDFHITDFIHRKGSLEILDELKNNVQFLESGLSDNILEKFYAALQEQNKENKLNKYLSKIDKTIFAFKFINSEPKLQVTDKYMHLSDFGDGIKNYIAIICAIYTCKNGCLFIDEIGSGIHYEKLDELWEIILTVSKDEKVQVFAVTHSKECLESYVRVVEKLNDKDVALVQLGKSDGKLKNIVFTAKEMINEVYQGLEVRGWDV